MNAFQYIKTGFKFIVIGTVLQIIYGAFDWIVKLIFKNSLIEMFINYFYKSCSNNDSILNATAMGAIAPNCIPSVSQFSFIIIIIILIIYLISAMIATGYLCEKFWNWE